MYFTGDQDEPDLAGIRWKLGRDGRQMMEYERDTCQMMCSSTFSSHGKLACDSLLCPFASRALNMSRKAIDASIIEQKVLKSG